MRVLATLIENIITMDTKYLFLFHRQLCQAWLVRNNCDYTKAEKSTSCVQQKDNPKVKIKAVPSEPAILKGRPGRAEPILLESNTNS